MSIDTYTFDVEKYRKQFPVFQAPENKDLVYLDNAATSQKPKSVLDAIATFHKEYNSNIHRSAYKLAEKATAGYECARLKIAQFIGAESSNEIVFTRGATESINFVAYGWAHKYLKSGDEIVVSELEHHSNLIPWQIAAQKKGATLKFIPITDDGYLDISALDSVITKKTKFVAITQASNVLGTRVDVKQIIEAAHHVGALALVDGCQHIPHSRADVTELDADFYAFSGHKMLGPMGIGILYAKTEHLDAMDPILYGGSMINDVDYYESTWAEPPWKFEAGTQNIPAVIGLGAAIDFIEEIGYEAIECHTDALTDYTLQELRNIKGVSIYGPLKDRIPVISFGLKSLHPHDLATFFDSKNVAIRSGHHCAKPLMNRLNVPATARASIYLYNTKNDIDRFIDVVHQAKGYFSKWV